MEERRNRSMPGCRGIVSMTAIRTIAGVLGLVWLAGSWAPAAHGTMLLVRNDVSYTLSFTDTSRFSDAQLHLQHKISQTADNPGDTQNFTFTFASPSLNAAVAGDADTAISAVSVLPGSIAFTMTSVDAEPGQFTIDFDRVVNSGTTLTTGVSGGFHVLEHRNNPNTSLEPGSPFTVVVMIPGDWSVAGSATGNHQLLEFNPLWTIDQNFEFDAGFTVFSAHIDNYIDDGQHSAGLRYRLIGAVVPLPPVWALLGIAMAGLAFARRR